MNSQRQKLKMNLKMTPQQLMLLKMLQVPAAMMEQTIKQEVEKNPLLEDEHCGDESAPAEDNEEPLPTADAEEEDIDFDDREIDPFAEADYGQDDEDDYRYREYQEHDRNVEEREVPITSDVSFLEHLQKQFNLKRLTHEESIIGNELIGSIDDAGYLGRDVGLVANDLAFKQNLDVSPKEVERVLKMVQTLDPAGVGARNLQECLSLQLHRANDDDPATLTATQIVDRCFNAFSKRHYDSILSRLNITDDQLHDAIERIKRLNPKPGSAYTEGGDETVAYVIPDFIVSRDENGLSFTLNDDHMPQLHVSRYYSDMLRQLSAVKNPSRSDRETIQFIRSKAESAQWFIDVLDQRRQTLQNTMGAILEYQQPYFTTGNTTDLRPMKLQDIASATNYDISTISRVVNQKYVQTAFGTFLLKDLFSKALTTDEGDSVSTDAIKHYLQEAVDNEDKRHPLTDEMLTKLLNEKGYPVARRTVAKYREMLGIPVGRMRKELRR